MSNTLTPRNRKRGQVPKGLSTFGAVQAFGTCPLFYFYGSFELALVLVSQLALDSGLAPPDVRRRMECDWIIAALSVLRRLKGLNAVDM